LRRAHSWPTCPVPTRAVAPLTSTPELGAPSLPPHLWQGWETTKASPVLAFAFLSVIPVRESASPHANAQRQWRAPYQPRATPWDPPTYQCRGLKARPIRAGRHISFQMQPLKPVARNYPQKAQNPSKHSLRQSTRSRRKCQLGAQRHPLTPKISP